MLYTGFLSNPFMHIYYPLRGLRFVFLNNSKFMIFPYPLYFPYPSYPPYSLSIFPILPIPPCPPSLPILSSLSSISPYPPGLSFLTSLFSQSFLFSQSILSSLSCLFSQSTLSSLSFKVNNLRDLCALLEEKFCTCKLLFT